MTIHLPESVERSIRAAVEDGRFASAEQAVEAAWREYDRGASTDAPREPAANEARRLIRGGTTIHGECLSIQAEDLSAEIRDHKGKTLTIAIEKGLVEGLAGRLLDVVGLDGEAAWDLETWEMVEFRATRITPYRKTDLAVAMKALADAVNGAWDEVDVPAYIAELRGEDLP